MALSFFLIMGHQSTWRCTMFWCQTNYIMLFEGSQTCCKESWNINSVWMWDILETTTSTYHCFSSWNIALVKLSSWQVTQKLNKMMDLSLLSCYVQLAYNTAFYILYNYSPEYIQTLYNIHSLLLLIDQSFLQINVLIISW